jgi:curved DNA binding protein
MSQAEVQKAKSAVDMEVEDEAENENLDTDLVLQKYKAAAQAANDTMSILLKECVDGKSVFAICELGDKTIKEKVKNSFRKCERGIAFPTSVSVNQVVCHFSPISEENLNLKNGDIVKIDLGVHIDGFIIVLAHTIVLSEGKTISGPQADLLACAMECLNTAGKLLRPGVTNTQLSKAFELICDGYGVNPTEGVLSHQLKRYVIDGPQVILQKSTLDHQVQEFTFKEYEVYAIDVVVTTGQGKLRELQYKPTIFKRHPETDYHVKLTSSKHVLKEIKDKYQTLPFHMKYLDPKEGRLGMGELLKHNLVEPFPVLIEKQSESVVHFKSTFFILKNDTVNTNSHRAQSFVSEKTIANNKELQTIFENVAVVAGASSKKSKKQQQQVEKGQKHQQDVLMEEKGSGIANNKADDKMDISN